MLEPIMKIKDNPNKAMFESVSKAVKENDGYCPCKLERTKETKCICQDFLKQTTEGECHCGRFIKVKITDEEENELKVGKEEFKEIAKIFKEV